MNFLVYGFDIHHMKGKLLCLNNKEFLPNDMGWHDILAMSTLILVY